MAKPERLYTQAELTRKQTRHFAGRVGGNLLLFSGLLLLKVFAFEPLSWWVVTAPLWATLAAATLALVVLLPGIVAAEFSKD